MGKRNANGATATRTATYAWPDSFDDWRQRQTKTGIAPVVLVAGSRGKSTVVRVLDALCQSAGLRTAVWTDLGVEIEGARQRGEFGPWSRAMDRLAAGTLDLAIREIDWSTVRTAGLQPASAPLLIVTNVCANHEACLIQGEAKLASQVLPGLIETVHPDGLVLLNGEDYAVSGREVGRDRAQTLIALNRETPLVKEFVREGGDAAWVQDGTLFLHALGAARPLGATSDLSFALDGAAGFQIHNALTAATAARAVGIDEQRIAAGLSGLQLSHRAIPGSFNVFDIDGRTVIIDRPKPSWFLRPVLRATRDRGRGRLLTVVGGLAGVPEDDLAEVGRLLGRTNSALILHDASEALGKPSAFRQGVTLNEIPPPIVHAPSERRAIGRALAMAKPRDTVLVLSSEPRIAIRAVLRAQSHADSGTARASGNGSAG